MRHKRSLKTKLREWLMNEGQDSIGLEAHVPLRIDRTPSVDSNGIRFKVFRASGGMVVETEAYDRQRDRHFNSLYVITDDQDLGKELGKIITTECLKS